MTSLSTKRVILVTDDCLYWECVSVESQRYKNSSFIIDIIYQKVEEQGNLSSQTKSTPTEGLVKEVKPAAT